RPALVWRARNRQRDQAGAGAVTGAHRRRHRAAAGRRRARRRARILAARARAVAGPVGAAGHRGLIAALVQRIGAGRDVDALAFAACDRARLAGAWAGALAAGVLGPGP